MQEEDNKEQEKPVVNALFDNLEDKNSVDDEQRFLHYEFKADPKQSPMRLDKFVQDRIENATRNKIQNAIKHGFIKVNQKETKSNYKIRPHDIVTVEWSKPKSSFEIIPEDIPIDVVFEDDYLMLINKPAGLVVHPGVGHHSGTLINALAYYFKDKESFSNLPVLRGNEPDRPGLVHRIDKNTTGLLLIAKTNDAMVQLSKQFFYHTIYRRYFALVWGDVENDKGTITGNIGRHPKHRKLRTVFEEGEEGKHAVTHYEVVQRFGYVTLIECQLETGRTHQIRVHMKSIGHPLFNDWEYGGNKIIKGTVFSKYKQFVENCFKMLPHQALHARALGFVHPQTKEYMKFECPLPDYFQATLDKWEKYTSGRNIR